MCRLGVYGKLCKYTGPNCLTISNSPLQGVPRVEGALNVL